MRLFRMRDAGDGTLAGTGKRLMQRNHIRINKHTPKYDFSQPGVIGGGSSMYPLPNTWRG